MDLKTTIELRSVQAAGKQDRFQPVHAGAHNRFTKAGYMHTGNKNRGGIATSEYFKTKGGNSRTVSVQADGSYVKTSRTIKGNKRSRGKFDAKGMKCGEEQKSVAAGGPGSGIQADWSKWNAEHPYEPKGSFGKSAQEQRTGTGHSDRKSVRMGAGAEKAQSTEDHAEAVGHHLRQAAQCQGDSVGKALHEGAAGLHQAAVDSGNEEIGKLANVASAHANSKFLS
jgi:hypothetical protein